MMVSKVIFLPRGEETPSKRGLPYTEMSPSRRLAVLPVCKAACFGLNAAVRRVELFESLKGSYESAAY